MRKNFIRTLIDIAECDSRVVLLTGDLGFTVLEPFIERFPDRFFNVGVAEQNMIGVATGLAEAGFRPFAYSIATFASMRAYEFIRNGPVLHHLPVRIVGVGGGVEYSHAGPTHHALEDIGLMRLQPGLTVVAPADFAQATSALRATWALPGPVYYRLGKDDLTTVPGLNGRFCLGRSEIVRDGPDILLLSTGSIASGVAALADNLIHQGIRATVAVVASLNPVPDDLVDLLKRFRLAVTVENHFVTGGLGSLVSELVAEHGLDCRVVRCGMGRDLTGASGSEAYLHARSGLDNASLADRVIRVVKESNA